MGLKGEKIGNEIFLSPLVPSKKEEYGSIPTLVKSRIIYSVQ